MKSLNAEPFIRILGVLNSPGACFPGPTGSEFSGVFTVFDVSVLVCSAVTFLGALRVTAGTGRRPPV